MPLGGCKGHFRRLSPCLISRDAPPIMRPRLAINTLDACMKKKIDRTLFATLLAAAALFMYGAVIVKMSNRAEPMTTPSVGDVRPR